MPHQDSNPSGIVLGLSPVQHDLVRRGLLALQKDLRNSIAEINYSMEKSEEGSDVYGMYVRGRSKFLEDIKEIDGLLTTMFVGGETDGDT